MTSQYVFKYKISFGFYIMNRKNNDFREPFHAIMPQSNLLPVWDTSACVPREEILSGKLTDAELALSLSSVVWGKAKPPYDDPRTFFDATHTTRNMQNILEYIFGRLSKARQDVNPIIVLDVGFGGGKTHTLVALYYAAKFGNEANVREHLSGISVPDEVNVVAISGDEYGEKGLRRAGVPISTIWGDLFYQLKVYDRFKNLDIERAVPSLEDVKTALGDQPLLILLDELPTYLKLVGTEDPKMMDKTVQFIQRLVLAVAEKDNAALVFAIAEDAYKDEAKLVINKIEESYKKAMEETRSHIRRKEIVMSPVEEKDVVHILKRRLFNTINNSRAEEIADAYFKMYNEIAVPEELKKADFRDKIRASGNS
jgi:predicted AAA+ superfamily ATPase